MVYIKPCHHIGVGGAGEEARASSPRQEHGPADEGDAPRQVWTWDFVHDTTMRGGGIGPTGVDVVLSDAARRAGLESRAIEHDTCII